MIGYYYVIVAETALERGSQVATFNKKHFMQVKGLSVVEPSWLAGMLAATLFRHLLALTEWFG